MAVITVDDLHDIQQTTLRQLNRKKFTQIASTLQRYPGTRNLMPKKKRMVQGGKGIQWNVMVAHANSARNVGLGAQDIINIPDTQTQATAEWRHTTNFWAMEGREPAMNEGESQIVDAIEARQIACKIAWVELMESNIWGVPPSSSDEVTPNSIRTCIVKNASEGFNGGAPSGFTTIFGINPSTYSAWKNYTAQYVAISKDDLIRKWRAMATKIEWMAPVEGIPDIDGDGMGMGWYTNYAVIAACEEILEAQNDNLGVDIASMDTRLVFRRGPVEWVPRLDVETTNPVYGINWSTMYFFFLRGWDMKQFHVPVYPGQHTMGANFVDSTYNLLCTNRRKNGVLATGTTETA